jgi:hypothetical protein
MSEKQCDKCGMLFDWTVLHPVNNGRWCGFCVNESMATSEEPQRDTWPSPAPTEVTP